MAAVRFPTMTSLRFTLLSEGSSEAAIRTAAGNPNGSMRLNLPGLDQIEAIPKPKRELIRLLQEASGLMSRRHRGIQATC